MEAFAGKWTQTHMENADAYLKNAGVNFLLRKMASVANPVIEYKLEEDGTWTFVFTSTVKSGKFNFRPGVESEEVTPDGRRYRSTITVTDGRLLHVQKPIKEGEKESIIERTLEDEKMYSTCTCDGAVAHIVNKRV